MTLLEALERNTEILAQTARDLNDRIHVLQKHGQSADATIAELIKTCDEIGRLNREIESQLNRI